MAWVGFFAGRAARQAQSGSPEEQIAFLQKVCRGWQSIDFGHLTKQRRFRAIKRQCIFEEFIPFNSDYKVFTLGGKPLLIQVDTSRYQGHRKGYYTPRWQPIPLMERHRRSSNTILESGGASGGAGGTRHDIFARSKSGKRFISTSYKYGKLDFIARPVALDTMLREATSIATQLGLRMLRVDFYTASPTKAPTAPILNTFSSRLSGLEHSGPPRLRHASTCLLRRRLMARCGSASSPRATTTASLSSCPTSQPSGTMGGLETKTS